MHTTPTGDFPCFHCGGYHTSGMCPSPHLVPYLGNTSELGPDEPIERIAAALERIATALES